MDCWHLKNKGLFDSFKLEINKNYPTLVVSITDNLVYIRGTIRIRDDKNIVLDSFQIEIKVPYNFPQEIPEVREIGNRIPTIPDRHFEQDGKACLCFRDALFIYWSEKSTILDFMKKLVEPFFLWQIEYEVSGGKNKDKAYAHGMDGAYQFYKEILNTDDIKVVYKFVEYLTKKKVKGHWNCYCGSGQKMRDCHFELMKNYKQKIRSKDAKKTLDGFNQIISKIANKK
jgi:hypothetical protein